MRNLATKKVLIATAVTAGFVALLTGCSARGKAHDCVSARIEIVHRPADRSGQFLRTIIVTDQAVLDGLADFFPQAGSMREGSVPPSGWVSVVGVRMSFSDNTTSTVDVSHNWDVWSEGPGDWPLRPGLQGFLAEIEAVAISGNNPGIILEVPATQPVN